jgi:hypothetical protein
MQVLCASQLVTVLLTTAGSGPRDSALLAFHASGAGPLLRGVMRSKPVAALAAGTLAFGGLVYLCFLHALQKSDVLPAYPWHLTGRVIDKATNPISDVNVTLLTTPRITGMDRLRERSPSPLALAATSDKSGRFVFDFSAAFFQVSFTKPGYANQELAFGPYVEAAPNTNPVLQVRLDPISR